MERWLVGLFMPVYGLLDAWRESFGRDFMLESEYYLALTNYRCFTPAGFQAAMQQANRLNTLVLIGKAPPRVDLARCEQLRILAQCLEIDSILQILAEPASRNDYDRRRSVASQRLDVLDKTVIPNLRRVADDAAAAPHVRAAVLRSLGLLARYKRTGSRRLQSEEKSEPQRSESAHISREQMSGTKCFVGEPTTELEQLPHEQVAEFESFSRSFVLERAPETCLYMAEHLLASNRRTEAESHLDEALRLCPQHPGALALRTKLAAPTAKA